MANGSIHREAAVLVAHYVSTINDPATAPRELGMSAVPVGLAWAMGGVGAELFF